MIKLIVICNFEELFWDGVDIVYECIGIFIVCDKVVLYLKNGFKCVLILVSGKDVDCMVVYGVNYGDLMVDDVIVLNVFCIINCLVLFVKVMDDNFGIKIGYMIMIYVYIGD